MEESKRPVRFERVLSDELELIGKARDLYAVAAEPVEPGDENGATVRARAASLCGLALSGGGIRSATFNLGILQALARHRLLTRFDYLSTVSGGGYIGAWLTAWIHRHADGLEGVQQELRDGLLGTSPEPREISWLRDYSNYLVLRLGYLSGDSWATISIYLRNLCLNLTLIVACLGLALLLPRLVVHALDWIPLHWFAPAGVFAIAIAIACIIVNLEAREGRWRWLRSQPGVITAIVLPCVLSALLLAHALLVDFPGAVWARAWLASVVPAGHPQHLLSWVLAGTALYTLPWLAGAASSLLRPPSPAANRFRWELVVLFAPFAGALIGLLCYAYSRAAVAIISEHWEAYTWLVTGFGTPVVLQIIGIALVLHIGLVSRGFSEDIREWWGRLGGWGTLAAIAWAAGFAVVVYAPAVVSWAGAWIAALGVTWIASTVAGVLIGRAAATRALKRGRMLERIVALLPLVFIAGLVVAITLGVHALLGPTLPLCVPGVAEDSVAPDFATHTRVAYCQLALTRIDELVVWMCVLAGVAFLLQWRVDVNVFSLGPLYRNRLLRCYLGASRHVSRRPHAFTGFDRDDDLALYDIGGPATSEGPGRPQRPYPIINTAINLTTGQKLAWQQRKAGSFVFTPLYCGYQMPEEGGVGWTGRYCPTLDYVTGSRMRRKGSIALSNAVTISGAAASPNAGYHSTPTIAFLLTVFSVRLGSWFQNPRKPEVWSRPGPSHSLKPLLSELFGLSNDRSDFVYLSDGGHFENLGIYELVRRRCRFIVACDASCDPRSSFEDLGNAIRKCRIDLGVDIEIDTRALAPSPQTGRSAHYCALGLVRYDRMHPRGGIGYLLYIKPAIDGSEPQDVAQYRNEHSAFPHQPTADQFFDEPQFESYRRLGVHIADSVLGAAAVRSLAESARALGIARDDDAEVDVERLFKELRQRWYPPLDVAEGVVTRQGQALDRIVDRIRNDPQLRFLDRQLHPEWPHLEREVGAASREQPWLPDDVQALRSAFYLCESIIQLMENVYLDLDLEVTHDHPDNRGWMNRFRRFAAAGMVRIAWAVSSASYGARFQSFCEHHLGLGDARVAHSGTQSVGAALAKPDERASISGEGVVLEALQRAGEIAAADQVMRFALVMNSGLQGARSTFSFPVAFAVLRPCTPSAVSAMRPGVAADGWLLRYFRVADHLRRMGVGWRVTLKLLEMFPDTDLDMATRAPELRSGAAAVERTRYGRMFRAAKRISARERPGAPTAWPAREMLP